MNTVLLALVIACASVLSPKANSAELIKNPLDAKLQRYVEKYNSSLPTMVAPTLRQDRVSVFNGVMTYQYTEITKTGAELARMNLETTQRPYIFPAICNAPDTGRMLKDGISFRYLYVGKDGKLAAQLIFLPADCAQAR
jgi:hypothetical protein